MPVGKWHQVWQSFFENQEVKYEMKPGCYNTRRTDVELNENSVFEIQHSYIAKKEVEERCHDYALHGKEVVWLIDGNRHVSWQYNPTSQTYTLTFNENPWRYRNFTTYQHIYIDIAGYVYRVAPTNVKSSMIVVKDRMATDVFVRWLKGDATVRGWHDGDLKQCTLYYNQRGAGCGKTYESIQLVNKHTDKTTFIYLTKVHSAKDVIAQEFQQQLAAGKMQDIEDVTPPEDRVQGKQYKIQCTRAVDGTRCEIVIATIDSFMYALGDKDSARKGKNFFEELVKSIAINKYKGFDKTSGHSTFSGGTFLNKECMIIVDETQDLLVSDEGVSYVDAIIQIMQETYVDLYMIGDKLQSIWGEHNVYTQFDAISDIPNVDIQRSTGENIVRRFHNKHFMPFVNRVVPFETHGLPEITGIDARFQEVDHIPYTIWKSEKMYANDKDVEKLNAFIDKLIGYVEKEIEAHKYMPHNFMFIFPFMSKNVLAVMLEARLQTFWIDTFKDPTYVNEVLSHDPYWSEELKDPDFETNYYKHAFLHKSEEGKPINIRESDKSTKLLTIHAAKGQGCEVVFCLGMTESSLKLYSNHEINLTYDSLLHVAVTRQKKSFYMNVEDNKDDIHERFAEFINVPYDPQERADTLNIPSRFFNTTKFVKPILELYYERLSPILNTFRNLIPQSSTYQKSTIEWGDHILGYGAAQYGILSRVNCPKLSTILKRISQDMLIQEYHVNEYYERLRNLKKSVRDGGTFVFPVLTFKQQQKSRYSKYEQSLIAIMKNIQKKLNLKSNLKGICMCPIEQIILVHIIETLNEGIYNTNYDIMNIYKALDYYAKTSHEIKEQHSASTHATCICNTHLLFPTTHTHMLKDQAYAIAFTNHSEKLSKIHVLQEGLVTKLKEVGGEGTKTTFNVYDKCFGMYDDIASIISHVTVYVTLTHPTKAPIHVICIVRPDLTILNFHEVLGKMILDAVVRNAHYACILPYHHNEDTPIWLDLHELLSQDDRTTILSCVRDHIEATYVKVNKDVIAFYTQQKTKHGNSCLRTIEHMLKTYLKADTIGKGRKKPAYLHDYFKIKQEECKKASKDLIELESLNEYMSRMLREAMPLPGDPVMMDEVF